MRKLKDDEQIKHSYTIKLQEGRDTLSVDLYDCGATFRHWHKSDVACSLRTSYPSRTEFVNRLWEWAKVRHPFMFEQGVRISGVGEFLLQCIPNNNHCNHRLDASFIPNFRERLAEKLGELFEPENEMPEHKIGDVFIFGTYLNVFDGYNKGDLLRTVEGDHPLTSIYRPENGELVCIWKREK